MHGTHLQIRAIVFSDEGAVTLAEDCNLLLDVLHFIFSLLQVNDLYSNDPLRAIVNAFEDLSKRSLSDPLKLGEQLLWINIQILQKKGNAALVHEQKIVNPKLCNMLVFLQ